MINLKDLVKAGVHFGHKTAKWSPKMAPFIWGSKNKIHLIDVSKTAFCLEKAGKFLKDVSSEGRQVLWVGTKKAASKIIDNVGKKLDMPVVTNRWIGGTLSNNQQIKKAITKLLHLKDVVKKSTSYYTKKELSTLQKEIARLEKNVGGIVNFVYPPAAIVVVDIKKETATIREARAMNIPIVAMVDTNSDPSGINFIIPSNDDAPKSIEFVISYLATQVEEGKKTYSSTIEKTSKPKAKKEEVKEEIIATPVEEIITEDEEETPVIKKTKATPAKKEQEISISVKKESEPKRPTRKSNVVSKTAKKK